MKIRDVITENTNLFEKVSDTLYHYTGVNSALKILKTGKFELTSSVGNKSEEEMAPRGYPYYLSTTRTLTGGYHDYVGSAATMLVLDGTWFNQRYPGKAVDYWQNRAPEQMNHRAHEAEDRIFSKEPSISAGAIRAIHLLIKPDADDQRKVEARRIMILAKQKQIPVYLYNHEAAWRKLNTRARVGVEYLRGQDTARGYVSRHRGYLMPWMELIFGQDKQKLSDRADQILYGLKYNRYPGEAARGLGTDLSNARKPGSGPDREHLVKILSLMRREKLNNLNDLIDWVQNRWQQKEKSLAETQVKTTRTKRHWLRPGELRGSYTDKQLQDLGFTKSESGSWSISQSRWLELIKSGKLK